MKIAKSSKSKKKKNMKRRGDSTSENEYRPRETVYLLDTNILYQILRRDYNIPAKLKSRSDKIPCRFFLLERVRSELHNVEREIHKDGTGKSKQTKVKRIGEALHNYGKTRSIPNPRESAKMRWAEKKYKSRTYVNDKGNSLSKVDCLILKYAMERRSIIVTDDVHLYDEIVKHVGKEWVLNSKSI